MIQNLRYAIDECRKLNFNYRYEHGTKHIKFIVNGKTVIISRNNNNPDRVRKDIRKTLDKA